MERTYTLHDILAVLRRRRALALAVAGASLVVGAVVALAVPSEYEASSVVQIEPRRLPADFFPAQYGASFEDRMRTVKHGVLARPVLERVIRETDFFPDLHGDMDEAVSRMRRAVEVRLEGEVAGGPPALLFVVEVRGKDKERVARAAELFPKIYAELTRQLLVAQARTLRETLDAQAADLGKSMSDHEARILAFKLQHVTELPEMVETNARALARVQSLMDMRLGAIADARRRRSDLLASVPEGPSATGLAEAGLDAAVRRLQSLEAAYGSDHPDVRRARREWQDAQARRDEELQRFRNDRVGAQLARIDADVRDDRAALTALEQERQALLRRIDAAPRWAQELAALSRDYDVLRGRYTAAVARRSDAAAAEALLAADERVMFRVVEAPAVPSRPVAPDRPRLLWLAVLAALALGLGAAGVAEWLDASVRGPEDAGALGVPVLAAIPRIGPAGRP
jgi:protein tyrosine kinase modulator